MASPLPITYLFEPADNVDTGAAHVDALSAVRVNAPLAHADTDFVDTQSEYVFHPVPLIKLYPSVSAGHAVQDVAVDAA